MVIAFDKKRCYRKTRELYDKIQLIDISYGKSSRQKERKIRIEMYYLNYKITSNSKIFK